MATDQRVTRGVATVAVLMLGIGAASRLGAGSSGVTVKTDDIRQAYQDSYRYEQAQNYQDAIRALTPLYERDPGHYTLNLRLGWLHYLSGAYANARENYTAALRAMPSSLEARLGAMLPLLAQQQWSQVQDLASQVLRIDAGNYHANLRLAYVQRMQGKLSAAERVVQKMLERYPTDVSLLLELALTREAMGERDSARAIANDILILDPENVAAKALLVR